MAYTIFEQWVDAVLVKKKNDVESMYPIGEIYIIREAIDHGCFFVVCKYDYNMLLSHNCDCGCVCIEIDSIILFLDG